ncbi:Uncharacterised protein [Bordetella pertussis]|nr:Uncharacterised protein [Bordetella pertussis]
MLGRQEQEADGDIVAQHRQAGLQGPGVVDVPSVATALAMPCSASPTTSM